MTVDSLPQSSIPITAPLRPRLGFLASTPIIAPVETETWGWNNMSISPRSIA